MSEPGRWVALGTFPFRSSADVIASVLDGHGIPARVTGDGAGGLATHLGFGVGYPAVEVPEDRLEEARALLASEDVPTEDDLTAEGADPTGTAGPSGDDRTEPPGAGDERATLVGFLRWQRETLEWKCAGLDAEQLARRAVAPSSMSLLGLVRHLTDVERHWFRRFLAGEDAPFHFWGQGDEPDTDFDGAVADPDVVADSWQRWREEVAFADAFVADAPDLGITGTESHRGPLSLRWVLTHMIEEYARHNGHADLLRERIDGAVGE